MLFRSRALYLAYRRDLEAALRLAERWWSGVVKRASPGLFSRKKDALSCAYEAAFAGPASCLELLGVVHGYWVSCVELNATLAEAVRIPPEVMLLHWLLDGKHDSWVQCLTGMPYWPIGLDADGRWV